MSVRKAVDATHVGDDCVSIVRRHEFLHLAWWRFRELVAAYEMWLKIEFRSIAARVAIRIAIDLGSSAYRVGHGREGACQEVLEDVCTRRKEEEVRAACVHKVATFTSLWMKLSEGAWSGEHPTVLIAWG